MNTLDRYFKMPTGGVTTRNSANPKPNNSKQQTDDSAESTHTEETSCSMSSIQTQLTEINNELKKNIKKNDIKSIIKNVVLELFKDHQEKIDLKFREEFISLRDENEKLKNENKRLAKEIEEHDGVINDLHNELEENVKMTKMAVSKSNYNEQYSRKNNIKFHGLRENI